MASNSTIKLNADQLRGEAKKIRKIKSNHDSEMSNLFRLVENLEAAWQGESQKEYYTMFAAAETTFNKFSQMLEEFASLMEYSANEMEAKDVEIGGTIKKASASFN